jgi:hypothetical protein
MSVFSAGGCGAAVCQPLWVDRTGGRIDIASPTVAGGVALVGGGNFVFAFDAGGCGQAVCDPLWKGSATTGGVTCPAATPVERASRMGTANAKRITDASTQTRRNRPLEHRCCAGPMTNPEAMS